MHRFVHLSYTLDSNNVSPLSTLISTWNSIANASSGVNKAGASRCCIRGPLESVGGHEGLSRQRHVLEIVARLLVDNTVPRLITVASARMLVVGRCEMVWTMAMVWHALDARCGAWGWQRRIRADVQISLQGDSQG